MTPKLTAVWRACRSTIYDVFNAHGEQVAIARHLVGDQWLLSDDTAKISIWTAADIGLLRMRPATEGIGIDEKTKSRDAQIAGTVQVLVEQSDAGETTAHNFANYDDAFKFAYGHSREGAAGITIEEVPAAVTFNLNWEVMVRLTDRGRELHREQWEDLLPNIPYTPPKEDAEGWSKWQLWCLMAAFGRHMYNGCEIPFHTDIKLLIESP